MEHKSGNGDTKVTDIKDAIRNNDKHSLNDKDRDKKNSNKKKSKNAKDYQKSDKKANLFTRLTSPLTGDFTSRDIIRLLLLIQSVALICICICLKKGLKEELK